MRTPPFCPNSNCHHHHPMDHTDVTWWVRDGYYHCQRAGYVRRFRCKTCRRYFSEATFSTHYYAKKRLNLARLRRLLVHGSSIRGAARQMFVSPTTITQRIILLCRQSLALHAELTNTLIPNEDLVADGFQSFSVSQYHPNNFNLLVGADSQYLYAMSTVTLRRSGRMTPRQKENRERIESRYPPEPHALEWSFTNLLTEAAHLWFQMEPFSRVLRTDEHKIYPRSVSVCGIEGLTHITVSSRQARTRDNPLFAINYLDREIRKDLAEHHRESVCFARNTAISTARMWIYLVWHNVDKAFRVSPIIRKSHTEVAGVPTELRRQLRRQMLTRRAFLRRSPLGPLARQVWTLMIPTPERECRMNLRLNPFYSVG